MAGEDGVASPAALAASLVVMLAGCVVAKGSGPEGKRSDCKGDILDDCVVASEGRMRGSDTGGPAKFPPIVDVCTASVTVSRLKIEVWTVLSCRIGGASTVVLDDNASSDRSPNIDGIFARPAEETISGFRGCEVMVYPWR